MGSSRPGSTVGEELPVVLHEVGVVIGHPPVLTDGLDRANRFARTAIDAFGWIDVELPLSFVDAVDRAFLDARPVHDIDARTGDHIRHR